MLARELLMEQNVALEHARQGAETAIRARNDFLAVMNHEMRTPMHAIIALSSLLQETELAPEQRSMVETVLKSSNLLATLINDVLDLSRLEDGSLELDIQKFNLPNVFKEVSSLVKPIASVKRLQVNLTMGPDIPEIAVGDDKRLLQTALNVVGNAVEFTKEGYVNVIVGLERTEYPRDPRKPDFRPLPGDNHFYIRVQVRDTGLGLNPQDIPMLFNKFVQADSTTTRNYGGTGLGLAICKRFVNLMDGHIWIESDGVGKGSVVTFIVKLNFPEAPSHLSIQIAPNSQPSSSQSRTDCSGVKILVTDDNGVNRMVTRGLLMRLGCEVTLAASGRECLQLIQQRNQAFNLLLLDVCMPEMDGYEVAVQIQKRLGRRERPLLVALTANTDRITREKCLRLGMDGVVTKPISLEKMRLVLIELLEQGSISELTQRL